MKSSRKAYKAEKSNSHLLRSLVSRAKNVMRDYLIHASTTQTNEDSHSPKERSSYYV